MQNHIEVRLAQTESNFESAKQLILEYATWLGFDLSFQNFDKEMDTLKVTYGHPDGGVFIAILNNNPVGVAGIKRFNETDCELKRMFIRENGRGFGIGKLLLAECIKLAENLNYHAIKLDTLTSMKSAIKIYADFGFNEIPAYRFNPNKDARYFELQLKKI